MLCQSFPHISLYQLSEHEVRATSQSDDFRASEYSRYKYGDDAVAMMFAQRIAACIAERTIDQFVTDRISVLTSPQIGAPNPSEILAKHVVSRLQSCLRRPKIEYVPIMNRSYSDYSYSRMDAARRKDAYVSSEFDCKVPAEGQAIFVDDLMVSGATRNAIARICMRNDIPPSRMMSVTLAQLKDGSDPALEHELNHAFIPEVNGLYRISSIVRSGHFVPNARNCRYLLCGAATQRRNLLRKFFVTLGEQQPDILRRLLCIAQHIRHNNDPLFLRNFHLLHEVVLDCA